MLYAENNTQISRPAPVHFNNSVNLIALAKIKQQAQKKHNESFVAVIIFWGVRIVYTSKHVRRQNVVRVTTVSIIAVSGENRVLYTHGLNPTFQSGCHS